MIVVALSSWSCGSTAPDVAPEVAAIVVSPATSTLVLNAQLPLQAQVQDGSGAAVAGASVTWTVQDPRTVSISPDGVVTALAVGTSQVAANALGKSGLATITVTKKPVANVRLQPDRADVTVGATVQLSASALDDKGAAMSDRAIAWTSSNAGVATVNGSGLITGVGAGSTTITAASEGKSSSATVTVKPVAGATPTPPAGAAPTPPAGATPTSPAVANVRVTAPSKKLKPGSTMQLTATALDSKGKVIPNQSFSWSSSSTNTATVSGSGLVTGKRSGNVTITASTSQNGGKSGAVKISVK
jgi:trimeric autotransporter adhesin